MSNLELKFTIELTVKMEREEVNCLQDAYDFGRAKSLITRQLVNQIYTNFNNLKN
tara:strand:+ start:52 stop:216 length:165 start_codon:yes stop_codon:yes gene_type:complete